jgi:thymidylate synthase
VKEQLARETRPEPLLYMEPGIYDIDEFRMEHFELLNYDPDAHIKAPMAV